MEKKESDTYLLGLRQATHTEYHKIVIMKTTIKMITQVAVITAVLNACGKKNDKPFSTFKIDGVEYKTNNVRAAQGKAAASFYSNDETRFSFSFQSGHIPSGGAMKIRNWGMPKTAGYLSFVFVISPNTAYRISPSDSTHRMQVTTVEGITTFTLEPSWFLREPDGEDSFLAEGVFVLPEVEKV